MLKTENSKPIKNNGITLIYIDLKAMKNLTIFSQFEDDNMPFILQNVNFLILNPRDLVLLGKFTPV